MRLIEPVNLIEKEHRVARAAQRLGLLDDGADILDAGEYRRERDELGLSATCNEARECRLAGARWPPQDHRMRPAGLQSAAQRCAGAEQMLLADEFI